MHITQTNDSTSISWHHHTSLDDLARLMCLLHLLHLVYLVHLLYFLHLLYSLNFLLRTLFTITINQVYVKG